MFRMSRLRGPIPAMAVVVAVILGAVGPALAEDPVDELKSQREQNIKDAAAAAAKLDELSAQDQELADAIAALDDQIALERLKVAAADRAIADAEKSAGQFRQQATLFAGDIEELKLKLQESAINAFMRPSDTLMSQLANSDLMEETLRRSYLGDVVGDTTQLIDELRVVEARRASSADAANKIAAAAEKTKASREDHLATLSAAQVEQEALRSEVAARMAEWQSNKDTFEQSIVDIGDEIRSIQAEAARKEAAKKAAEAARQAAAEAARQAAAAAEADSQADATPATQPPSTTGEFVVTTRPVPGRISSPFGPRRHPVFGSTASHPGIDMQARSGDPIHAAADGVVITARWINGYGNAVIISHGPKFSTLYAHQSKLLVSVGDQVSSGDVIGLVGSTGWSTGPHLHFEVRINGTPVNPAPYLPSTGSS